MSPKTSRRNKILKAARELFEHYGTHKTTVSDIAKSAKISVGSVYLEFSSKDDIIKALSNQQHNSVLQAMEQALQTPNQHAEERLRAMFHARTNAFLSLTQKGHHAPDLVKQTCNAVKDAHALFCQKEREILMQFLETATKQQELSCHSIQMTTQAIEHIMLSLTPPVLFHACPEHIHTTIDALCDLILQGLSPRL